MFLHVTTAFMLLRFILFQKHLPKHPNQVVYDFYMLPFAGGTQVGLEDGASRICRVAAEIFLTAPGWGGDKLLERAMAEEKDVPGSSVKGCLNVPGCDPLLSSVALDN